MYLLRLNKNGILYIQGPTGGTTKVNPCNQQNEQLETKTHFNFKITVAQYLIGGTAATTLLKKFVLNQVTKNSLWIWKELLYTSNINQNFALFQH